MSIQSQINRINAAVNTQADKIAQIKTALEGKAACGGGGASIETCTVTYEAEADGPGETALYSYVDDGGNLVEASQSAPSTKSLTVLKNSIIYIEYSSPRTISASGECTLLHSGSSGAVFVSGDCTIIA